MDDIIDRIFDIATRAYSPDYDATNAAIDLMDIHDIITKYYERLPDLTDFDRLVLDSLARIRHMSDAP